MKSSHSWQYPKSLWGTLL